MKVAKNLAQKDAAEAKWGPYLPKPCKVPTRGRSGADGWKRKRERFHRLGGMSGGFDLGVFQSRQKYARIERERAARVRVARIDLGWDL